MFIIKQSYIFFLTEIIQCLYLQMHIISGTVNNFIKTENHSVYLDFLLFIAFISYYKLYYNSLRYIEIFKFDIYYK